MIILCASLASESEEREIYIEMKMETDGDKEADRA